MRTWQSASRPDYYIKEVAADDWPSRRMNLRNGDGLPLLINAAAATAATTAALPNVCDNDWPVTSCLSQRVMLNFR